MASVGLAVKVQANVKERRVAKAQCKVHGTDSYSQPNKQLVVFHITLNARLKI